MVLSQPPSILRTKTSPAPRECSIGESFQLSFIILPACNRHHQDFYMFSADPELNLHFPLLLGVEEHPKSYV